MLWTRLPLHQVDRIVWLAVACSDGTTGKSPDRTPNPAVGNKYGYLHPTQLVHRQLRYPLIRLVHRTQLV